MTTAYRLELTGNPRISRHGWAVLASALSERSSDGTFLAMPQLKEVLIDYPKAVIATELRAACEARGVEVSHPA